MPLRIRIRCAIGSGVYRCGAIRFRELPDHDLTSDLPAPSTGLGSRALRNTILVLTSYSTLLRNTLYAVQRLGFEAVAVVLESLVLLGLVLYGVKTGRGLTYFLWAYAAQYAFSCAYFVTVLAAKRLAVIGWRLEL